MSDSQNHWERIQLLFDEAVKLAPEKRADFLEQTCGEDTQLRAELESLLASYEPGEDELENSPVHLPNPNEGPAIDIPIDTIPGYKLLREIHRGGQGVVYQAIQQSTKRKVALKVLLEGPFSGPASKRRFEREVELVGSLRHPGIVPIFDSGVAHGQYFYAMAYIRGTPLDAYVRDASLSAREILSLFVEVCNAVDHAHQRGVIHRDLKPTNVLVDEAGQSQVIDFGLAKIGGADSASGNQSLLVSVTGQIMGTIGYMSPEQAAGQLGQIDMRSDVYALGVMLYELLSGELPYDLRGSTAENLNIIQHGQPKRLNSRVGRVDDEARTMVLKCLSKEKSRRYPTAGALAEDIGRYLRGEPIEAKRDSALYVLKKTLRRHIVPTVVATTIMGLICISSVVSWSLYIDSREARKREAKASVELKAERDAAAQRSDQIYRGLYYTHMTMAGQALGEGGGISQVIEHTQQWHPDRAGIDLRGWEWYYLDSLARRQDAIMMPHGQAVNWSLDWNPDATKLVVASNNRTIQIWDTAEVQSDAYRRVDWSPDGTRIASAGAHGEVQIWNSTTLEKTTSLQGHSGLVISMKWNRDSSRLATVEDSGRLIVWNVSTAEPMLTIPNTEQKLLSVCWDASGTRLATGNRRGTIQIWKVDGATPVQNIVGVMKKGVFRISWSPDSNRIAAVSRNGVVSTWDVSEDSPSVRVPLLVERGLVSSISWSPDSRRLVAAHADRTIRVWDLIGQVATNTLYGHTDAVTCVRWSPDGSRLASTGSDSSVRVWDVPAADHTHTIYSGGYAPYCIDWEAGHEQLVVGATDTDKIDFWDVATGKLNHSIRAHDRCFIDGKGLYCILVRYSPDSKLLASAGADGTVRLWNPATRKELRSWTNSQRIYQLSWSFDASRLAMGGIGSVRICDVHSGEDLYEFTEHRGAVNSVSWSPVDFRIASAGSNTGDPEVKIWDANTGEVTTILRGHENAVKCLDWSPGGSRIATGSLDRTVRIWDAYAGEEIVRMPQTDRVGSLAWSPHRNQPRVAAASMNGTVRIWDAREGKLALTLRMPVYGTSSVRWSRDGSRIAAVTGPTVKIWDATVSYQNEN